MLIVLVAATGVKASDCMAGKTLAAATIDIPCHRSTCCWPVPPLAARIFKMPTQSCTVIYQNDAAVRKNSWDLPRIPLSRPPVRRRSTAEPWIYGSIFAICFEKLCILQLKSHGGDATLQIQFELLPIEFRAGVRPGLYSSCLNTRRVFPCHSFCVVIY